mmetsp:Transcript_5803/g.6642  ORF Transcript_5803/g.6642 Transcript_5803/m.6642 type:complete len:249 (-) Transcript_5803:136-882(-)
MLLFRRRSRMLFEFPSLTFSGDKIRVSFVFSLYSTTEITLSSSGSIPLQGLSFTPSLLLPRRRLSKCSDLASRTDFLLPSERVLDCERRVSVSSIMEARLGEVGAIAGKPSPAILEDRLGEFGTAFVAPILKLKSGLLLLLNLFSSVVTEDTKSSSKSSSLSMQDCIYSHLFRGCISSGVMWQVGRPSTISFHVLFFHFSYVKKYMHFVGALYLCESSFPFDVHQRTLLAHLLAAELGWKQKTKKSVR